MDWLSQPGLDPAVVAQEQARRAQVAKSMANHNRLVNVGKGAAVAGFGAALLPAAGGTSLGSLFSGGAPAVSSTMPVGGAAGTVAKAAGSRFSLNGLLGLGQLGANLFGSITGNRAAGKAQNAALAEQQRQFNLQQQMLLENEATRKSEADRVANEERARWEASQKMTQAQWDAQQQDRVRQQRLEDDLLSRQAQKRAIGEQARQSLFRLIGGR